MSLHKSLLLILSAFIVLSTSLLGGLADRAAWARPITSTAASLQPPLITVQSLPAQSGVIHEARTVIEAPAERVAALAGDPGVFVELLPAKQARVVGTRGKAVLVEVVMPAPWPVSQVRWTELVQSRMESTPSAQRSG